jgi:glutamine---fructose-6-phosphate transaminase (isomerizing)
MLMFITEKEMEEGLNIFNSFDSDSTKALASRLKSSNIILTGMGSSIIFPGNNAVHRAASLNLQNRIESYYASELLNWDNFENIHVFLCSNSGETKETILLQKHIKKKGATSTVITAVANSYLAKQSEETIILKCGFEEGVAATKSVIEQALILDSLVLNIANIHGRGYSDTIIKKHLIQAAKSSKKNLMCSMHLKMIKDLKAASSIYFAGRVTGVSNEITLKAHEIARKNSYFYPDTHIVHGVEESFTPNPIILVEPDKFKKFIPDFKAFSKRTGSSIYGLGTNNILGGVKVKSDSLFHNYCLLAGGWGLLSTLARSSGIDMDKPSKIKKVGNPYRG